MIGLDLVAILHSRTRITGIHDSRFTLATVNESNPCCEYTLFKLGPVKSGNTFFPYLGALLISIHIELLFTMQVRVLGCMRLSDAMVVTGIGAFVGW